MMKLSIRLIAVACCLLSNVFGRVDESVLPAMDGVYSREFGNKVNGRQRESMLYAAAHRDAKLRVMTYNMLYNAPDAEAMLPAHHRWECRKPRLLQYLQFARADVIGSQELQEDQVQEIINVLGSDYGYFGQTTRGNEGRSDVNAIFFLRSRVDLVASGTIPYDDEHYENAFTYCRFRDKVLGNTFVVLNTKLTWGNVERRLAEAVQLNDFSNSFTSDEPVVVLGDFNVHPFIEHDRNIFLDGDYIEEVLAGNNLKDAKRKSIFGHFGPICSITHSRDTLKPFVGPQLPGFILDHILVNENVDVFTHGIDTAKVDGEYPSDHFPVVADLFFRTAR